MWLISKLKNLYTGLNVGSLTVYRCQEICTVEKWKDSFFQKLTQKVLKDPQGPISSSFFF